MFRAYGSDKFAMNACRDSFCCHDYFDTMNMAFELKWRRKFEALVRLLKR